MTIKELKGILNQIPDDCKVKFTHSTSDFDSRWGFKVEKFVLQNEAMPYDISFSEKEVSIFLEEIKE